MSTNLSKYNVQSDDEGDDGSKLSYGEHDDDGDEESPTSAAHIALLKRWLQIANREHEAATALRQDTDNPVSSGTRTQEITEFRKEKEVELAAVTGEMHIWISTNDADGTYTKMNDCAMRSLKEFHKIREELSRMRSDAITERHQIRNQASVVPETMPAYVEAAALQKKAENDIAANDTIIENFISSISPHRPPKKATNTPPKKAPKTAADTLFAVAAIADGYTFLESHPELAYPSRHPNAAILERVPLPALRSGMAIPILQFSGPKLFDTLVPPRGYYVVISEHADGSIRLALGYEAIGANLPQVLVLEKRDPPITVLTLSDTALRSGLVAAPILDSLRKIHAQLVAPDTPIAARMQDYSNGSVGYNANRETSVKSAKAFAPLRRALHHDTTKFQRLTQHMTDLKLTDPSLGVNIRNMSCAPALHGLAAMQTENIPHLLGFHFCAELDFTGKDHKLDAINLHTFLRGKEEGDIAKFESTQDIRRAIENAKRVYMTVMMEESGSATPFWGRIFNRLLDLLQDINPERSIEDLNIDFVAWKFNSMFVAWSELFKAEQYANKPFEEFTRLNEEVLQFDPIDWQNKCARMAASRIPPQKVPPTRKVNEEKVQKHRQEEQARDPKENSKRRKTGVKPRPPAVVSPTPPVLATNPPPLPTVQAKGICVRNLFHTADPTLFPGPCKPPCNRQHNVKLRNGKLAVADKAAVRTSLEAMSGKFAELALQELDRLL